MQHRYGNRYVTRMIERAFAARPGSPVHDAVHDVAASGLRGAGRRLPQAGQIEEALGGHRLDSVRVYTDAAARAASRGLGADAYTMGERIAFATSDPDPHTVVHEVAHVIQQRAGARPDLGSAGQFERCADGAADAIRSGRSPLAFLPGARNGEQASSAHAGPGPSASAVQARVSIRTDQSFLLAGLLGVLPPSRVLRTYRELEQFVGTFRLSIGVLAAARYPVLHRLLPTMLPMAGQGMIGDAEPRLYDNNLLGAIKLANDIADGAYGGTGGPAPEQSSGPLSPLPEMSLGGEPGSSTSRFEYWSGVLESAPIPTTLADYYSSEKLRPKMKELMSESPVMEGVKGAITSRVDALTHAPRDPRPSKDLIPWGDYYLLAGGAKDMERTVKTLSSKMSPEERRQFEEDFAKLKLDKQIKLAAGAGAGIVAGQLIGMAPVPAAKGAKLVWQATGAVAASNKIAEVNDQLQEFGQKHPKAFKVMEERRDEELAKLNPKRDRLLKVADDSIKDSFIS